MSKSAGRPWRGEMLDDQQRIVIAEGEDGVVRVRMFRKRPPASTNYEESSCHKYEE